MLFESKNSRCFTTCENLCWYPFMWHRNKEKIIDFRMKRIKENLSKKRNSKEFWVWVFIRNPILAVTANSHGFMHGLFSDVMIFSSDIRAYWNSCVVVIQRNRINCPCCGFFSVEYFFVGKTGVLSEMYNINKQHRYSVLVKFSVLVYWKYIFSSEFNTQMWSAVHSE